MTEHPPTHYETRDETVRRKSAYGIIKETELTNRLTGSEQNEYYALDRIKARFRTPEEQARLEELSSKAEELHVPKTVVMNSRDDLGAYAAEVGARMRERNA